MSRDDRRSDDEIATYVARRGQGDPPAGLVGRIVADVRRTPRVRAGVAMRRGSGAVAAVGSFVLVAVAAFVAVALLRTPTPGIGSPAAPGPTDTAASPASASASPASATASPEQRTAVLTDPVRTPTPGPTEPVVAGAALPTSSWALVADELERGVPGTIEAATNATEFERIWTDHLDGLPLPRLGSDEFAIFFQMAPPSDCDSLTLTGVALDAVNHVVYGMWSDMLGCSSEIGSAHIFVVTMKRDAVPSGQLRLRLTWDSESPCGTACGFTEEIEITL